MITLAKVTGWLTYYLVLFTLFIVVSVIMALHMLVWAIHYDGDINPQNRVESSEIFN